MAESLQYVFFLWLSGCSFRGGWMCEETPHWIGGGYNRKVSPSGDGMTHTEVEHGIWFMLLGSEWAWIPGWYRLDQSKSCRRVMMVRRGEAFSMHKWTKQPQASKYSTCIHSWQETNAKDMEEGFCKTWAFAWSSMHSHTGWPWHRICLHRYVVLRICLWHLNRHCLLISRLSNLSNILFSSLQRTAHCWWAYCYKIDFLSPSFCPLSERFLRITMDFSAYVCTYMYAQYPLTWLLFILYWRM